VLDRDGTLIEYVPYLSSPAQVKLLPTVVEALQLLRSSGFRLFLHTNQAGVGRGYYTRDAAHACNDEMLRQIGMGSGLFERLCVAFESPDDELEYRKPSPRFGREIMESYGIAAHEMCYIGDNVSDLQTAENLSCVGIGVNTGHESLRSAVTNGSKLDQFLICDSLLEAAEHAVADRMRDRPSGRA
jgi:D-glycero-D-manno-heptose 1,7-bisphosphate phosphatase